MSQSLRRGLSQAVPQLHKGKATPGRNRGFVFVFVLIRVTSSAPSRQETALSLIQTWLKLVAPPWEVEHSVREAGHEYLESQEAL